MPDNWDDEQLMAALRESLDQYRSVPPEFIEAGKNAFAWHNVDAEIAQLTYDSTYHQDTVASMRSETASIRALTFTSAQLTIELEVAGDSLLGQVIPARPGTIEVQTRVGVIAAITPDELGCFTVCPIPDTPFRLYWQAGNSPDVMTGWITL